MKSEDSKVERAHFYDDAGKVAGTIVDTTEENMNRMMACWNVCAGISTEALLAMPKPGVRSLLDELRRLHADEMSFREKDATLNAIIRLCDRILKDSPYYRGTELEKYVKALLAREPGLKPDTSKH